MRILLTSLGILIHQFALGQEANTDVKMLSEYGSNNSEMTDILKFQNIDYFRVKFVGKDVKGKTFAMYCKEMWNGKLTKVDTLVKSTNNRIGQVKTDTLALTVFGMRVDGKLKVSFRFPTVGINKKYEAIASDDYSLRAIGTDIAIKKNTPFPAFAYILPYEEDGWKMYCAVDQSGTDVEDWGKRFKIKHYLIFEISFSD